jgi:hypothetical protein
MNLNRLAIYIFITSSFCVLATKPVHAAQLYLPTQTATTGTVTPSPSGLTSTPSQTFTPTMVPSDTATTTLIPLPAITLIFPKSTATPTATITPTPGSETSTPQPAESSGLNNLSPRFKLLAFLIVLLWLILIGFSILYIRQFR